MARHDQRPDASAMTCPSCRDGRCPTCVDVDRAAVGLLGARGPLCTCTRSAHPAAVADSASEPHSAGTGDSNGHV